LAAFGHNQQFKDLKQMAQTKSAGLKKVIAMLLLIGPAFLLVLISTRGCQHKFKELEDYGEVSNYTFTDAAGKAYSSKDFQDQVVIITTLQTSCPDSCSISFWHIDQLIYQHIRKNKSKKLKQVKIISFVVDAQGNPVEDLSVLQEAMKDQVVEYDPAIWYLAKGNPKSIYDITHNKHSLLEKGDEYFAGEAFTELMLLLDKKNHLRMVLNGKTEGMIRRMKEHVALLQKQYDKTSKKK
jgi:cytochrome oxidase Cu insertion factor (SCO1/SenC/PrrC family)